MPLAYPVLYNGPVSYFTRLVREQKIILEQHENYTKQTYRNRCRIMGPNGILDLVVPVKRVKGKKNLVRDIRIDYDTPWNRIHWRSMVASYAASPFFDFVKDELFPYYNRPINFLFELNLGLLTTILNMLRVDIPLEMSASFTPVGDSGDPRSIIHPKLDISKADPEFHPVPYHQVFSERHGFQPDLSVVDLIFNEGPHAPEILKGSLRI